MNWRGVVAVARKDLLAVRRSRAVMVPIVVLPPLILVGVPLLLVLLPQVLGGPDAEMGELQAAIESMPASVRADLAGYNAVQQSIVLMTVYFLAPAYLLVPILISSVIAADSFAGEKERRTLEPLLYTPLTDGELLLGKLLAAWVPAVAVGLGSLLVESVVVNVGAWPIMGRVFFPTPTWIVLAVWVTPAVAGVGLCAMVMVSARVRGFQEASQLGGLVVLPVVLLLVGQTLGVVYLGLELAVVLGLALWGVVALLLWLARRTFRRTELIAR